MRQAENVHGQLHLSLPQHSLLPAQSAGSQRTQTRTLALRANDVP